MPIAPVRIADVMPEGDMEYFLSSQHWMDALTPPLESHLRMLASKVRALLEMQGGTPGAAPALGPRATARTGAAAEGSPMATPNRPPARVRRKWAAPGLVMLCALIAGAAAAWVWRQQVRPTAGPAPGTHSPTVDSFPSKVGQTWANTLGMTFAFIPAGDFVMGSPEGEEGRDTDEVPHKVKLTRPFLMGVHLVTRGQFAVFCNSSGYQTDAERQGFGYAMKGSKVDVVEGVSWKHPSFEQTDDHPVVEIDHNDASAFCQWLGEKEKRRYHLPTEAQWEYACRAGTQTAYFWGNDADAGKGFANCFDWAAKEKLPVLNSFNWSDGFVYTSPVGSFKPNAWGLYDMIGNALEWCADYYAPYPPGDEVDPTGPAQGDEKLSRVLRGGSWFYTAPFCRAAYRAKNAPGARYFDFGFRVALDVP
jgi:formylglycine-generating enzyme required for sulfatase activity